MRLLRRLDDKRRIIRRKALCKSAFGGTGFLLIIWLAFGLSSVFPPLAPIGLPIVILGALVGTFAVITIIGVPLGMIIY